MHDASLVYSAVSIGGVDDTFEPRTAVAIYCGRPARNALPSTEYTASCEIAAAPRRDCAQMCCCFHSRRNLCMAASSPTSSSSVLGADCAVRTFGLGTWN